MRAFALALSVIIIFLGLVVGTTQAEALKVDKTLLSPARWQLNASVSASISAQFNLVIDPSTVTNQSFMVFGSSSGICDGVLALSGSDKICTFAPDVAFKAGEQITVILTEDIKSSEGLSLTNGYSWSFFIVSDGTKGFSSPLFLPVSSGLIDVAGADLGGNSSIDFGGASATSNNVYVFINSGSGNFPLPGNYNIGGIPNGITIADFDKLNGGDLATSDTIAGAPDCASLVLNNPGENAPRFRLFGSYASAGDAGGIFSSDFNNDGWIDLVYATGPGPEPGIAVGLNTKNPSGPFPETFASVATPGDSWGIFSADCDDDGDADIIITSGSLTSVHILRNDGDGNFPADSMQTIETGGESWAITAADFNNDNLTDLVVSNRNDSTFATYVNTGISDSLFARSDADTAGSMIREICCANMTGDANIDLACTDGFAKTVTIYEGDGNGLFSEVNTFQLVGNAWGITAADFNDDGRTDLAIANTDSGGVSLIFSTATKGGSTVLTWLSALAAMAVLVVTYSKYIMRRRKK